MKEQQKNLRRNIDEMEISNLPDKELKIVVIKTFTEFGKRKRINTVRKSRERKYKSTKQKSQS